MTTIINQVTEAMAKAPMTEVERQQKAVEKLGPDFEFPLFNGRQAVESQRKSGYKNSARAAREIIDNAYEAGANNVWIVFRRPDKGKRQKHERRDAVSAVAFIDDGPGMIPEMARFALSWGGGTRFEDPAGIGRFGFGLPNASINQTRRVEVYSRTDPQEPWSQATLDITPERLDTLPPTGLIKVDPPMKAELPEFVTEYASANGVELKTGTVVVWEKPDRLTARSGSNLRELMLDDFGVVYRYLLDDFTITVDSVEVQKTDPLFLTPDARYYKPTNEGGAECTLDKELAVKYWRDKEMGSQHLQLLESVDEVRAARADGDIDAVGVIIVKVARFPYGFAARSIDESRRGAKDAHMDEHAQIRLEIRKKRRGMSFVRARREVDTQDVFPTSKSDRASGLGSWPVLQGYALHWGIEVSFTPTLDEAFGIGNDKQTVAPIEDFWRVMAKAEVDAALRKEQSYQADVRQKVAADQAAREAEDPDAQNPAMDAAANADLAMGRSRPMPTERVKESKGRFEDAIKDRQKEQGETRDEAEEAVKRQAQEKPYSIRFFESEGGVFLKPDLGNGLQKVAMINKAHPFFTVFYSKLTAMGSPLARQAVDLLLVALSRAELATENDVRAMYEHQRESEWSPFLKLGLKHLEQMQVHDPEEAEEDVG